MAAWKSLLLGVLACACLLNCVNAQVVLTPEQEEELLVLEIREHVLAGNMVALQEIMANVTNTTTIARGFRFEEAERQFFTRVTPNRDGDPDVTALRGFANTLLFNNGDPDALAKVFTAVLYLQGDNFVTDPASTFKSLFESFSNPEEMQAILDADPREIFEEDATEPASGPGRRLMGKGKPADTPLCSSCFEKKFCKKNAPWC